MKIKTFIFSVVNNKISTASIFATVVKKTSIHITAAIHQKAPAVEKEKSPNGENGGQAINF